jgi:hypothetical protein
MQYETYGPLIATPKRRCQHHKITMAYLSKSTDPEIFPQDKLSYLYWSLLHVGGGSATAEEQSPTRLQ